MIQPIAVAFALLMLGVTATATAAEERIEVIQASCMSIKAPYSHLMNIERAEVSSIEVGYYHVTVQLRNISPAPVIFYHAELVVYDTRPEAGIEEEWPGTFIVGAIFAYHSCKGIAECQGKTGEASQCFVWPPNQTEVLSFYYCGLPIGCGRENYSMSIEFPSICYGNALTNVPRRGEQCQE